MMSEQALSHLYYLVLIISAFLGCFVQRYKLLSSIIALAAMSLIVGLIGMRDISVGYDTINYWYGYNEFRNSDLSQIYSKFFTLDGDILFKILIYLSSRFGDFNFFLCIISILFQGFSYVFSRNIARRFNLGTPLLLWLTFMGAFYVLGEQINVIRSGVAMIFVLNFVYYLFSYRNKKAIIYGILAVGFHFTMLIPVIAALVVRVLKVEDRFYWCVFVLAIVISYLGFGIENIGLQLAGGYSRVQRYITMESSKYVTGFRLSFVVFNTVIAIFVAILGLKGSKLFRYYLITSAILFLSFNIPYFDRIGASSWNIMPFIIYLAMHRYFRKFPQFVGVGAFLTVTAIRYSISLISA